MLYPASGVFLWYNSCVLCCFRFLELEINGKFNEILLHYIHDQKIHIETFPFRLANNHWQKVALTISGNHVTLYINCSKLFDRHIKTIDRQFLTGSKLDLYIGQRNQHSALFMVSIRIRFLLVYVVWNYTLTNRRTVYFNFSTVC